MHHLTLKKIQSTDFKKYFLLVSDEQVMKMITERAIPLEEARKKFEKIVNRNNQFEIFGSYKVYNDMNEYWQFNFERREER